MLQIIKKFRHLRFSELMGVYEEGNRKLGAELYPEESEFRQMMLAEQDFYQYLQEVFFRTPGAVYALCEESGRYVSALRLEPFRDGLLVTALETRPDCRRQGWGEALLRSVQETLGTGLYSHVYKENRPSLRLHEKCGFRRISETAAFLDGSVNDRCCTLRWEG